MVDTLMQPAVFAGFLKIENLASIVYLASLPRLSVLVILSTFCLVGVAETTLNIILYRDCILQH